MYHLKMHDHDPDFAYEKDFEDSNQLFRFLAEIALDAIGDEVSIPGDSDYEQDNAIIKAIEDKDIDEIVKIYNKIHEDCNGEYVEIGEYDPTLRPTPVFLTDGEIRNRIEIIAKAREELMLEEKQG